MSAVATAIVGGAVIGGVVSAQGAKSAANTQAAAQDQASANQMAMFNTIQGQEQPFMNAGVTATNQLSGMLQPGGYLNNQSYTPFSFDPSSITSSPGYQFAQKQGLAAVANNEAPNVGALSGPALKALTQFSTGNAAQYYNDYFNQALNQYTTNFNTQQTQQQNIFSRLANIANLGQNAASNTGQAGASLGTGAAQATAAAGASQAAGTIGASNALSGAVGGIGNAFALNSILSSNSGIAAGGGAAGYGAGYSPATATGSSAWGLGMPGS